MAFEEVPWRSFRSKVSTGLSGLVKHGPPTPLRACFHEFLDSLIYLIKRKARCAWGASIVVQS